MPTFVRTLPLRAPSSPPVRTHPAVPGPPDPGVADAPSGVTVLEGSGWGEGGDRRPAGRVEWPGLPRPRRACCRRTASLAAAASVGFPRSALTVVPSCSGIELLLLLLLLPCARPPECALFGRCLAVTPAVLLTAGWSVSCASCTACVEWLAEGCWWDTPG